MILFVFVLFFLYVFFYCFLSFLLKVFFSLWRALVAMLEKNTSFENNQDHSRYIRLQAIRGLYSAYILFVSFTSFTVFCSFWWLMRYFFQITIDWIICFCIVKPSIALFVQDVLFMNKRILKNAMTNISLKMSFSLDSMTTTLMFVRLRSVLQRWTFSFSQQKMFLFFSILLGDCCSLISKWFSEIGLGNCSTLYIMGTLVCRQTTNPFHIICSQFVGLLYLWKGLCVCLLVCVCVCANFYSINNFTFFTNS